MQRQVIARQIKEGDVLFIENARHTVTKVKTWEQSEKVLFSFGDRPDLLTTFKTLVYRCDKQGGQAARKRYGLVERR